MERPVSSSDDDVELEAPISSSDSDTAAFKQFVIGKAVGKPKSSSSIINNTLMQHALRIAGNPLQRVKPKPRAKAEGKAKPKAKSGKRRNCTGVSSYSEQAIHVHGP